MKTMVSVLLLIIGLVAARSPLPAKRPSAPPKAKTQPPPPPKAKTQPPPPPPPTAKTQPPPPPPTPTTPPPPPALTPPPPPPTPPTQFDYNLLAIQSGAGFCSSLRAPACSGIVPSGFTVHGLWPTNNSRPSPQDCQQNIAFDESLITPALHAEMVLYWPSFILPNDQFWEHEWVKHGTCSNLGLFDYFDVTVKRFKEKNITEALEKSGIITGQSKTPQEILNAIQTGINLAPVLSCKPSQNPSHPAKTILLVEVRLCLDKTAVKFQNCPATTNPFVNCGNGLVLIP